MFLFFPLRHPHLSIHLLTLKFKCYCHNRTEKQKTKAIWREHCLKIWKPAFYSVMWHDLMSSFLTITFADSKFPHLQSRKIVLNELSGCFQSYIWATEGKLESISVLTRVNKIVFCWFWVLLVSAQDVNNSFALAQLDNRHQIWLFPNYKSIPWGLN